MTLREFWDAFWADNAPYFIGAYDNNSSDEMISHSMWSRPNISLESLHIHEQADLIREIERKVDGNKFTRHTHEKERIFLVEENEERITLKVMTTFDGVLYSDRYQEWSKWEIFTHDPRSHQVVFRKTALITWEYGPGKPWVVWRYIQANAEAKLASDVVGLDDWLQDSAQKYVEGLPHGPYENAIWPPLNSDIL